MHTYYILEISEEHKIIDTKNMHGLDLKCSQLYVAVEDINHSFIHPHGCFSKYWRSSLHIAICNKSQKEVL